MERVTVVCCLRVPPDFRNRNWMSVTLRSVRAQGENVRAILVDYGSVTAAKDWIKSLCYQYGCELIEAQLGGQASPGRAWNIGIKESKTKYTAIIDSDIVLGDGLLSLALSKVSFARNMFLTGLAQISKDGITPIKWDKKTNKGNFMFYPTRWLHKVHGFDEAIKGWGLDDADLYQRAIKDGLVHDWISGERLILTRPHEVDSSSRSKSVIVNDDYIKKQTTIIRNPVTWGETRD